MDGDAISAHRKIQGSHHAGRSNEFAEPAVRIPDDPQTAIVLLCRGVADRGAQVREIAPLDLIPSRGWSAHADQSGGRVNGNKLPKGVQRSNRLVHVRSVERNGNRH